MLPICASLDRQTDMTGHGFDLLVILVLSSLACTTGAGQNEPLRYRLVQSLAVWLEMELSVQTYVAFQRRVFGVLACLILAASHSNWDVQPLFSIISSRTTGYRKRETGRERERGSGREGRERGGGERERERENSELRTLLLKDKDFRHLPILTICPC